MSEQFETIFIKGQEVRMSMKLIRELYGLGEQKTAEKPAAAAALSPEIQELLDLIKKILQKQQGKTMSLAALGNGLGDNFDKKKWGKLSSFLMDDPCFEVVNPNAGNATVKLVSAAATADAAEEERKDPCLENSSEEKKNSVWNIVSSEGVDLSSATKDDKNSHKQENHHKMKVARANAHVRERNPKGGVNIIFSYKRNGADKETEPSTNLAIQAKDRVCKNILANGECSYPNCCFEHIGENSILRFTKTQVLLKYYGAMFLVTIERKNTFINTFFKYHPMDAIKTGEALCKTENCDHCVNGRCNFFSLQNLEQAGMFVDSNSESFVWEKVWPFMEQYTTTTDSGEILFKRDIHKMRENLRRMHNAPKGVFQALQSRNMEFLLEELEGEDDGDKFVFRPLDEENSSSDEEIMYPQILGEQDWNDSSEDEYLVAQKAAQETAQKAAQEAAQKAAQQPKDDDRDPSGSV